MCFVVHQKHAFPGACVQMPLRHVKHFTPHGKASQAAVSANVRELSHSHPEMSRAQRIAIAYHAAGEHQKKKKKKHLHD